MFWVYIIHNPAGRHYIGQTNNLEQRLVAHNNSIVKSTKGRGPWELVTAFEVKSRSEAVILEKILKNLKNAKRAIEYLQNLR